MDAKERYFWDLTGYLVVKNVLDTEELETANAAIDYCADRINQGEDNKGVGDSTFLRGTGSRWMHGTNLLNIVPLIASRFARCWPTQRWSVG
ncbi:TPA: hypothetical protein EYO57_35465 [Candidatus Poribacteria bacterium]|nr:hypothetical protein [Candidatus Poribacteria bacterium]